MVECASIAETGSILYTFSVRFHAAEPGAAIRSCGIPDSCVENRKGRYRGMTLKIGSKITDLRKKKGLTQEQLAAALGVSAPAVSKWETGGSYPDITLLCPLARALGTDVDFLLAFEEELSEEDLGRYMARIVGMVGEGNVPWAEKKLMELLHTYPASVPLKFSAAAALSLFDMSAPESGEADRLRWSSLKKELVQAVHDDGNPAFFLPAVSMLVSFALAEDDLEKAERLLRETPADSGDLTMLWARLHLKKGNREEALTVSRELRWVYLQALERDACFEPLRGEERFLELTRRLREQEGAES